MITTTSSTTTTHRATLAGGITADLEPSIHGAVLTLGDGQPRGMSLPVLPGELAAMASWGSDLGAPPYLDGELPCSWVAEDVLTFVRDARLRAAWCWGALDVPLRDDFAALRALAVALRGEGSGQ